MNRSFALALVAMGALACACSDEAADDAVPVDSTDEALRKCAAGPTLRGVDVSEHDGAITWSKVKASGKTFAFARTSDGNNHPDVKFAANWKGMKDAGIIRGAYQFFRPAQDATKQANNLIKKIVDNGGLQPGDLPPVLDLEVSDGVAAATVVARAKTWLAKVEAKFGVKPIVYTGNNMNSVTKDHFSSYALWVPNYGATCPLMPPGWKTWTFWQDSESGTVSGIGSGVDLDYFNGNLDALKALTLKAAGPVTPDPEEAEAADESETTDPSEDATMGSSK
jgi:lysozyme